MKVALVQCPVWGTREPPLGIVQLAACLKNKGINVKSFDFNNFLYKNRAENVNTLWAWEQCMVWYDKEWVKNFYIDFESTVVDFMRKVTDYVPDVVGFSVSASSYHASCCFADLLKELNENIKIVFGGTAFIDNEVIEKAFSDSKVDYIISGDADEAFPELVAFIDKNADISECAGVYFSKEGNVCCTGDRPQFKNFNKLPYMDFSDLRIEDYDDTVHLSILSSRGCIWNCVFCSTRAFNKGYTQMSAERIHQEITYHRVCNYNRTRKDNLGHVDFMDLEFNGDMDRLRKFCELMIKYPPCPFLPKMRWVANAVIRPEMTREITDLMAEAGCKKLIFGIESGSQKVLDLMKKKYKISDALKVIKAAHSSGIEVTTNFMFGFPGETEEDFLQTLDLLREIGPYVERVYPSRTYCAVEQYSYLQENLPEFGIKTPVNHHLYWETLDSSNTYPVRLDRCARFEKLCNELNVLVDCGVKTSVEMDNWYNLAYYYEYKKDFSKAAEYFLRYLKEDPKNENILSKLNDMYTDNFKKIPDEQKKK